MDNKMLKNIYNQLNKDPESLPWPQRREIAKNISDSLLIKGINKSLIDLINILACDPKWEVRKDIADFLHLIPDKDFNSVASKLTNDSNIFVQKALTKALDRKRRERQNIKQEINYDQLDDLYSKIEKEHGSTLAKSILRNSIKLYDLLINSTVHDIRGILTPLKSNIVSILTNLNKKTIDHELLQKKMDSMFNRVEIMENLINDMRLFSQATPTKRRLENVSDVINQAYTMVKDFYKAEKIDISKISVKIDVPDNLTVKISRYQIVMAIHNVIKNAFESFATSPDNFQKGNISIKGTTSKYNFIEIFVKDDGMGMNNEELEEISRFKPGGTSKKNRGTGYGLPIASRKIRDHKGHLHIESEEDKGTEVLILLPINPDLEE